MKISRRIHVVRVAADKTSSNIRASSCMTRGMSKAAQQREKQPWTIEFYRSRRNEVQRIHNKMRGKSWNCLWNQPGLVRSTTTSARNPVAKNPTLADQNMHASLRLMNLRGGGWKELCQKIMKIALWQRG